MIIIKLNFVILGFEVLTVVTMKIKVFHDIRPSVPIELHFYRTIGRHTEECSSLKLN
jgi:hypothetical protein